jgi:hypothetical protein
MVIREGSMHEFRAIRVRHWKPAGHSVKLRRHVRKVGSKADLERKGWEKPIRLARRR